MLKASEARAMAIEANRSEIELERIEPYIKEKAMNGEYKVTLYPSRPLHPNTLKELRHFGYKVTSEAVSDDYEEYSYCITWGKD